MKKKALTVALILTGFLAMGFLAGTTWSGYQSDVSAGTEKSNAGSRPRFPSSLSDRHIREAIDGIELSEDQNRVIQSVAKDLETRMAGLRAPFFAEVEKTLKDAHEQIMAQLDAEQKTLAQKNIDDWNRRIRQGGFSRRGSEKKGGPSHGRSRGFRDWENKADVDNDGKLTDAERTTYWDNYWKENGGGPKPSSYDWGWIVRNFAEIDTDKNGLISPEECTKARVSSRHSSGRFGGPGGGRGGRPAMSKGDRGDFDSGKTEGGLSEIGKPIKEDQ